MNILALTTEKRYPAFPDIPSIAELGYPDLQSSYWTALQAPKGTPMDVVQQISAAAIKAVQEPKFHEMLTTNGQTMKAGGPEVLDAQLQHDQEFWGKIIKENNIVLS